MLIDIVEADYVAPYKIHLWFSDGTKKCVDFEPFLNTSSHPEIRKYLDINLFKHFSIAHGRLDWNDYDLCFPVQDLYEGKIITRCSSFSSCPLSEPQITQISREMIHA